MASTTGRRVVELLTNKSGGAVAVGDVVVVDTGNNEAFTTSTAGGFTGTIGVAQDAIANNAAGRVCTSGYVGLVNVNASVTRGNYGKTHTVAKQATDAGSARATGAFCQFLTGGTTPTAHLFGLADSSSSASGVPTGTSNPGSPANGDLFYRTDLDLLIRYRSSGTRWVCTCLHVAPLNMQTTPSILPMSATGSLYAGLDTTGRDLWVERVALATTIPSGTSDATRFWTITSLTDGGSANAYGTFDTKTDGNAATRHDLTTSGTMASGAKYFELIITKTSTVGNIYVVPGGIIYRYIIT